MPERRSTARPIMGTVPRSHKKNPARKTSIKGAWYLLYSPKGTRYYAYEKPTRVGWQWTEWMTYAKRYKSYAGAKREFDRVSRRMIRPSGSVLMVAISEEARSFLL